MRQSGDLPSGYKSLLRQSSDSPNLFEPEVNNIDCETILVVSLFATISPETTNAEAVIAFST